MRGILGVLVGYSDFVSFQLQRTHRITGFHNTVVWYSEQNRASQKLIYGPSSGGKTGRQCILRAKWFSVWGSYYCFMWFHMMQPAIVLLWLYSKIQTLWSPSGLPQPLHSLTDDAVKLPCSRGWWQRLVHHSLWKIVCWEVCFLALYLKMWRRYAKLCMGVKLIISSYLSIFPVLWQLSPSSGTQTPFLSV